jgi:hypothetical protein
MNKFTKIKKQLIRSAVIAGVTVVATILFYLAMDAYKAREEQAKIEAQAALTRDNAQMENLKSQLNRSTTAARQFVEISANHLNPDYAASNEGLKILLRNAKAQYRLSNDFRLSITPEKPTDKSELNGLAYDIFIRPEMKLEFRAISDVHLFSFLKDFVRQAPGVVRIDGLTIKRSGEMDDNSLNQMNKGQPIYLVEAIINFSWISIVPKEPRPDASIAKEPGK